MNNQHKKWLLLIEDELDLLSVLDEHFTSLGYSVLCVSTISEAIKKLTNQKFECIILDMRLHDGDGEKIINFVRKTPAGQNINTPIMVCSGNLNLPKIHAIMPLINDILLKPFDLITITNRVEKQIQQRDKLNYFQKNSFEPDIRHYIYIDGDELACYDVQSQELAPENKLITSSSLQDAEHKLSKQKFDGIIMHYRLHSSDARILLSSMRSPANPNALSPLMLITAPSDMASARKFLGKNDQLLTPPFSAASLEDVITSLKAKKDLKAASGS